MIRVTIELVSARTGETSTIGRMLIANTGTSSDGKRGDYEVRVLRRGAPGRFWPSNNSSVTRTGEVKNYPRLAYNVWRLVLRALKSAFPEES